MVAVGVKRHRSTLNNPSSRLVSIVITKKNLGYILHTDPPPSRILINAKSKRENGDSNAVGPSVGACSCGYGCIGISPCQSMAVSFPLPPFRFSDRLLNPPPFRPSTPSILSSPRPFTYFTSQNQRTHHNSSHRRPNSSHLPR